MSARSTPGSTDEAPLRRLLGEPLRAPGASAADHLDPELLTVHAASELDPEDARAVDRHLAVCDDGRCLVVLREVLAGFSLARDALYGAPPEEPPSEPAPRSSQPVGQHMIACREALWASFEALAQEEGCSVDTLIGEAMRSFVQQRSRPRPPHGVTVTDAPGPSSERSTWVERNTPTSSRALFAQSASLAPLDPPRERNTPTLQRTYLPAPRPPRRGTARLSPVPPATVPPRLSVVVDGIRYGVNKPRFVIGRGPLSSDLAIQDPDISRQHALIELVDGRYHLVDMGSTNGIERQGERVARWPIAHGDRVRIGDHELEFLLDS
ncbi:MAG: FHA domain-containing protein [Byssovorax sp.]